jgi:hypothetical protein
MKPSEWWPAYVADTVYPMSQYITFPMYAAVWQRMHVEPPRQAPLYLISEAPQEFAPGNGNYTVRLIL